MRTPDEVGAIEYRSGRVIERNQYAPKPMMAGTMVKSTQGVPTTAPTMTIVISTSSPIVAPDSRCEAISRPGGCADGCRLFDRLLGAVDQPGQAGGHCRGGGTRARQRAGLVRGLGLGELAARGEAQDVGAHRLGVGRGEVLELDVRVEPRPDHLELGRAEQSRDHRRVRLTPCTRSSGAGRCVRNRMPVRTSTSSPVMRNVWNRHET